MNIVIYTQRVEIIESYNERRDCADQRIADFLYACGYLPIPIPNNVSYVESMVEKIKPCGIILTGGNSLVRYGGNAPERDETDKKLIEVAINKGLPLYGFCRGMQSILDYFGIPLEQIEGHVAVQHEIKGSECGKVNSYHNQGCKKLAHNKPFQILAVAEDGVIEAIKHNKFPIFGTMWHPEREKPFKESDMERIREILR